MKFNDGFHLMNCYIELLKNIIENGEFKGDRTGTGTRTIFGHQMRFDLRKGFPLLTTKKVHMHSIIIELLWFLRGDTNVKFLQENNVKIWNEWATADQTAKFGRPENELGPVYGHQWRKFGEVKQSLQIGNETHEHIVQEGFDQIKWLINEIKTNPDSRRLIVTGWNPNEAQNVALPPCHTLFQFFVNDGYLSCQLYQRSADVFLGVPFNIASYALLTHFVAQVCDLKVKEFIWTGGDIHLYSNHLEQAKLQIQREPMELCQLKLNPSIKDIFEFNFNDVEILNYQHHPAIKAPISV